MNPLLMQLKCKSCQGDLDPNTAVGGVVVCRFCGNTFTLPKNESNNEVLEALRDAERELERGHFEEAFQTYQRVSEENEDEPEAYFGMALANAKVQYLNSLREDEKTGEPKKCLQPICYDIIDKKFTEDRNYKKALDLATPEQRKVYYEKGKEIDDIRKKFNELKSSGIGYDCFICTKVSEIDNKNRHTEDCYDAEKLYDAIKEAGYNPFFSEKVLNKGLGVDYEAYILYALYSSPCMIIVCSDEAYLQTPWVRNEYTRFLQMIKNEEKHLNSITFAFKNGNIIEKLPGVSGKIQGVAIDSFGAKDRIIDFVSKFSETRNRIPDINRKEYGNISAARKNVIEQQIKKRDLKIERGAKVSASEQSKLDTVQIYLNDSDFKAATSYAEKMIDQNPKISSAYWLLGLAKAKVKNTEQFISSTAKITSFDNIEKAISTESDAAKRKVYYDALFARVKQHKHLNEYEEYISLPESDPKKVEDLSDIMYQASLETKDENLFKTVLKTVTNTDKYIKMNKEFMVAVPKAQNLCYANILEVDKSDGEALYETFLTKNSMHYDDVSKFLENDKNFAALEKEVYAYGFNEYATAMLYHQVLRLVGENKDDKACKIFDFVLKVIPKSKDKLFVSYLQRFIDCLLRLDIALRLDEYANPNDKELAEKMKNATSTEEKVQILMEKEKAVSKERIRNVQKPNFDLADGYNDLLIHTDPHNHDAFFNRFLIRHRISNLLELVGLIDFMSEDDDYCEAITQFNEVHPDQIKNNKYYTLKNVLKTYVPLLENQEEKEDVIKNLHPNKEEIFDYSKQIQDEIELYHKLEAEKASDERNKEIADLKAQIKKKYEAFCKKHKISKEDDVYKLKKDVSKDPILFEIKEIAEKLAKLKSKDELTKVNEIINGQKSSAFRNTRRIIVNIFSVLFLLVTFAAGAAMLFISICGFMGYNSSFYIVSIGLFKNNLALILYMLVGIAAIVLDIFIFKKRYSYSALLLHIFPIAICTVVVGMSYYYKQNAKLLYYDNSMIIKYEKNADDSYTLAAFSALRDFDAEEFVLPQTYNDLPVTTVGKKFYDGIRFKNIKKLTVPESYTKIDKKAFYGNSSISEIVVSDSVTEIGELAFYKCKNLTTLTLGDGITELAFHTDGAFGGKNMFGNCKKLTTIYFGSGLKEIGEDAFYGHSSIAEVHIKAGTNVGKAAFQRSSLKKLIFEDDGSGKLSSIGENAFEYCDSLAEVDFANVVSSIGEYAFEGCDSLSTITIPTSVKTIGDDAFKFAGVKKAYITGEWITGTGLLMASTTNFNSLSPEEAAQKLLLCSGWRRR